MPKIRREVVPRKTIRIPESIVDEVDEIVRESGLYFNRQQFIESAIREKVEKFKFGEDVRSRGLDVERIIAALSPRVDDSFLVRVKETFLAHAVINVVKEKDLPSDHSDPKRFEPFIRRYLRESADRMGEKITEERLEELTMELLNYHRELLAGLRLMESH